MGIEPTGRTVNVRPNGFEDRAQHQLWKRSRYHLYLRRFRVADVNGVAGFHPFLRVPSV